MTSVAPRFDNRRKAWPGAETQLLGGDFGLRRRLSVGVFTAGIVVLVIFAWGGFAQLSGAVVASGSIVSDRNNKKVQHPQGGVISEIRVKNGDRVVTGDLLIRLDDTQARATFAIISTQLVEWQGRNARLAAERDNSERISFPPGFDAYGAEAARVAAGEQRLFEARKQSTKGRKEQLAERIKQSGEEIKGLVVQRTAKLRELALIHEELARMIDLQKRNLLPVTRVLSMQRDEARIDGENGVLLAQIARLGSQIAEMQLQIIGIDQDRFSDAQKELRDVEARLAELQEKKVTANDQLRRVDLRSPIDGVVHELNVHTVGGVIGPADQLMFIVPSDDALSIEVRVPVAEIDRIAIGQRSVLRFPAFNQRTTPEVKGTVTRLSPDISRDSQSGQPFYTARVTPDGDISDLLQGQALIPGMPVESFIETTPRTALSYLVKPFTDQLNRAFRER